MTQDCGCTFPSCRYDLTAPEGVFRSCVRPGEWQVNGRAFCEEHADSLVHDPPCPLCGIAWPDGHLLPLPFHYPGPVALCTLHHVGWLDAQV